ncbi:MAG: hypothetical protein LH614_16265 [Pyrinomonadaceae bacterium]|nr:hypothetical protein [Pyrinomonadaceae bacterium]
MKKVQRQKFFCRSARGKKVQLRPKPEIPRLFGAVFFLFDDLKNALHFLKWTCEQFPATKNLIVSQENCQTINGENIDYTYKFQTELNNK